MLQPAQCISCCPKRKLNSFLPSTSHFFKSESRSSLEFEFCSRLSPNGLSGNRSMSYADELFLNGKIRPMKLSSHLKILRVLVPLVDLREGGDELGEADSTSTRGRDLGMRNTRYAHRKIISMSPFHIGPTMPSLKEMTILS
ncbi:Uncharacterized protein Adt_06350 [Abeliophyllum distichum]|uniref:Uncharacterized protein n=1 Tax=Abeliophyllum distichum TaxID=126358 RepID=A0ABD1V6S0_9LAMI